MGQVTHPLLAHFLERARDVDDVASVEHDGDGVYALRPRRDGALGLWIGVPDDPTDEVVWGYEADWSVTEDVRTAEELDRVVDAVVGGRIRVVSGPRRLEVHRLTDGSYERVLTTWEGVRLPRPGWRRRARVVTYATYRD